MVDVKNKEIELLSFEPFNNLELKRIGHKIICHEEIQKKIQENMLDDFAVSWEGMFLHQAYHFLKSVDWSEYDERMNSIFYCSLEAQTMQLEWIMFSLFHGQYDLVLRELRNIVESAFLFYRIDNMKSNRKKAGAEKFKQIESLPENERFGKKVFEFSGYDKWQDVYKNIYRKLCYYTHTSIAKDKTEKAYSDYNCMLSPVFSEEDIYKCLYYIQKVILLEVDMMKIQLRDVYGVDAGRAFEGIFDKEVFSMKI